jgi:hypothetical protein
VLTVLFSYFQTSQTSTELESQSQNLAAVQEMTGDMVDESSYHYHHQNSRRGRGFRRAISRGVRAAGRGARRVGRAAARGARKVGRAVKRLFRRGKRNGARAAAQIAVAHQNRAASMQRALRKAKQAAKRAAKKAAAAAQKKAMKLVEAAKLKAFKLKNKVKKMKAKMAAAQKKAKADMAKAIKKAKDEAKRQIEKLKQKTLMAQAKAALARANNAGHELTESKVRTIVHDAIVESLHAFHKHAPRAATTGRDGKLHPAETMRSVDEIIRHLHELAHAHGASAGKDGKIVSATQAKQSVAKAAKIAKRARQLLKKQQLKNSPYAEQIKEAVEVSKEAEAEGDDMSAEEVLNEMEVTDKRVRRVVTRYLQWLWRHGAVNAKHDAFASLKKSRKDDSKEYKKAHLKRRAAQRKIDKLHKKMSKKAKNAKNAKLSKKVKAVLAKRRQLARVSMYENMLRRFTRLLRALDAKAFTMKKTDKKRKALDARMEALRVKVNLLQARVERERAAMHGKAAAARKLKALKAKAIAKKALKQAKQATCQYTKWSSWSKCTSKHIKMSTQKRIGKNLMCAPVKTKSTKC